MTAALLVPGIATACTVGEEGRPAYREPARAPSGDVVPPGPTTIRGVDVVRQVRPVLSTEMADSCGGWTGGHRSQIRVRIDTSADDVTPPEDMGYRIEHVDGNVPKGVTFIDEPLRRLGGETVLPFDDRDDDEEFSFRVRVVPIDEAGNEGPPSEPFEVHGEGVGCSAAGGSGGAGLAVGLLALVRRRR